MTNHLLQELLGARTLDPVQIGVDLRIYHYPFDDMTGKTEVELRLRESLARGERVALIGATGSGKTSTAAYVVDSLGESTAPFRIGVAIDDPLILGNPGRFAQHVVRRLAMTADQISASLRTDLRVGVADEHEIVRARSRSVQGGLNVKIASISGSLGTVSQSITERTSAQEMIELLEAALQLVAETGSQPLLIFDDTDTWIQVGYADLDQRRASFFGDILRMLSGLGCGLLIAVHPQYLPTPEFRNANAGFLSTTIEIPRVPGVEGLASVLDQRVVGAGGKLTDVFEDEAVAELFREYEVNELSLRAALRCASTALAHAVDAGKELIGVEAIALGLRELLSE